MRTRRAPRDPIGPGAGLRDLLDLYADSSLAFRLFLAHRWWHAHLSDLERCIRRGGVVLDLGCGHGIFANLMALRDPDRRILALEKDPARAALARGRLTNISVEEADIVDRGFDMPDAVTITDVLHHLRSYEEQERLLDEVASLLRPGGQLVLKEVTASTPLRFRLTRTLDWIAYPGQRFYFRRHEDWMRLLEARGFSVEFRPLWRGTPYASFVITSIKVG